MILKLGRYRIGVGRDLVGQVTVPTTVRRFLFFWLFKEARLHDVDRRPRFRVGTGLEYKGRYYRYCKAGDPPPVPPAPPASSGGGRSK